jgi:hypothetical protein
MTARIFKPGPSATQSGKAKTKSWVLVYEPETALHVEPLMGWTSSTDMQRQIRLHFSTKDEAIAYAERNGLAYRVELPAPIAPKVFSYADNFKSTRRGQWTH